MAEKATKKPNILVRAGRGLVRFFRDTRGEMKKIVWPTPKQIRNNLIVVLIFVLVLALLIIALDFLFSVGITSAFALLDKATTPPVSAPPSSVPSVSGAAAAIGSFLRK